MNIYCVKIPPANIIMGWALIQFLKCEDDLEAIYIWNCYFNIWNFYICKKLCMDWSSVFDMTPLLKHRCPLDIVLIVISYTVSTCRTFLVFDFLSSLYNHASFKDCSLMQSNVFSCKGYGTCRIQFHGFSHNMQIFIIFCP